ncbi:hypothetical protein ACYATP_04915 [Lactobacillaceae bacterium Melli_B4]
MWQYILAIVVIICGTAIVIDKRRSATNNDELKRRMAHFESEVGAIESKLNHK